MKIGELARQAGVNIQTLRFYERERLLRSPVRTQAGYRIYESRDLERVRFIRVCQGLGFTLREIRDLAQVHDALRAPQRLQKRPAIDSIVTMANERLAVIDQKIRDLKTMRSQLARMSIALSQRALDGCPASC